MKLEKICRNYNLSRNRRKTEKKYNLKEGYTADYARIGCYECDGHNNSCSNYFENTPEFFRGLGKHGE